jgi:hypothetical protein
MQTGPHLGWVTSSMNAQIFTALIRTDRLNRLDAMKETLEVLPLGVSRGSQVLSGESDGYLLRTSKGWLVADRNFSNGRFLPKVELPADLGRADLGRGRIIFLGDNDSDHGGYALFVTFSDPLSCK